MSFIGIDLGASFIKGAVLDLESLRFRHILREIFPDFLPGLPPLFREVDPHKIMGAVRSLIEYLVSQAPDCQGIVICGQMHGVILVNDRGEPLSNFISWQDQRVLMPHPSGEGSFFHYLRKRIAERIWRRLGNELRPGLPLGSLFWLNESGKIPSAKAIPTSLSDFVLANLCAVMPCTELTNAAAHGALNLERCEWDSEVLGLLGLHHLCWPPLRSHGEVVGYLVTGSVSIPCYTPVGDQQCALLGAFLREGELSINIATGAQVSMISSGLAFGDYQTRPFFEGQFLRTITHIPAGRSLNLLIRFVSEFAEAQQTKVSDPWAYIERSVAQVPETDLRVNLAFFASSCGDRGEISNLSEQNLTVGHLFRASYENMAENFYAGARRLSPSQEWRQLVFSGGIAQKLKILREIIEGKFRVASRLCFFAEDTLLGLLALALAFQRKGTSTTQVTEELGRLDKQGHSWS